MKSFRIYTVVWGENHLNWFQLGTLPSLLQGRNLAALESAAISWDIMCESSDHTQLTEIYSKFPSKIPLRFLPLPARELHACLREYIKQCVDDEGRPFFLAPPDTVFSEGSVEVILAIGQPNAVCVAIPHVRVNSETWEFDSVPIRSTEMVDKAFDNLHVTWRFANQTLNKTNSFEGGVSWKRLSPGFYAVHHLLPTYYFLNPNKTDLDCMEGFGWFDHRGVPENIVRAGRHRVIGSSDGAFIVELTPMLGNIPTITNNNRSNPTEYRYENTYSHHHANRNCVAIFRGVVKKSMKTERLHILMPVSRPQNLPMLMKYYLEWMEPHPYELRWHLLVQGPDPDPKGYRKIDEALENIKDGWIFTPSDDSIHADSLFRTLSEVSDSHTGAVVFNETRGKDGTILFAKPENIRPCHVDGSQIICRREFIGEERFNFDTHGGTADGKFIQRLYENNPNAFVFVDDALINWNSMEW